MKQDTGKRTLEGHALFPYVAWALTAGFAFFVYNITTDLQAVTEDLQTQAFAIEERMNQDGTRTDFDAYAANRLGTTTNE